MHALTNVLHFIPVVNNFDMFMFSVCIEDSIMHLLIAVEACVAKAVGS